MKNRMGQMLQLNKIYDTQLNKIYDTLFSFL